MASDPRLMIVRQLFSRLVFSLQIDSSLALKIIAFWMWIEGNGHVDFVESINAFDDYHVWAVASTAKSFVEAIHLEHGDLVSKSRPNMVFREHAIEGINFYINNFCYEALEDLLGKAELKELIHQIGKVYQGHLKDQCHIEKGLIADMIEEYLLIHKDRAEGTSSPCTQFLAHQILQSIMEALSSSESTNRLAEIIETLGITEKRNDANKHHNQLGKIIYDERTLFVTFSTGYNLAKDELHDFFMRYYGDVEEISVEKPVEPSPPLYALVKFLSQETLFHVLDGNKGVKLMINGKQVWAQKYVQKDKNNV